MAEAVCGSAFTTLMYDPRGKIVGVSTGQQRIWMGSIVKLEKAEIDANVPKGAYGRFVGTVIRSEAGIRVTKLVVWWNTLKLEVTEVYGDQVSIAEARGIWLQPSFGREHMPALGVTPFAFPSPVQAWLDFYYCDDGAGACSAPPRESVQPGLDFGEEILAPETPSDLQSAEGSSGGSHAPRAA
jgi:hypothetical protein